MTGARLAIGAFGLALLGYAAVLGLTTVASAQYPALIAPVVVAFGVIGRGTARRIGPVAAAVARAALVAAACCSLVLIPGLVVRAVGARNPTIHVVDYPLVLAGLWIAAVAVAGAAVLVGRRRGTAAVTK